jgi:hypothetical protein
VTCPLRSAAWRRVAGDLKVSTLQSDIYSLPTGKFRRSLNAMTIQAFERSPRWIARCSKVLLAIGWITFVSSITSPILHRLAWRYEVIGLLLGPVLMFSGLVVKYASRPKSNRSNALR